jgi:hypothetical protein
MDSIRSSARRRGLRVAAQVASIAGVVAASAALSHAAPGQAGMARAAGADVAGADVAGAGDEGGKSVADQLTEAVRVRNAGNCGCAPCWGPPAPPPMREELLLEAWS